ncbi:MULTISPECIES: ParA family protein [Synechocystis]|uniref:ParA family protein n=1 Tax=Synechocystis salina LEGE 00031 TaxID=1828736 RepID=A0ABR9VUT3_9SYNC|nr:MULTISPECIES: ParA family protein [Synechocystis]MBD2655521.1 ParA family protein [Synechocystis sp. FACHB-383]MBE9241215.1 ParA family protein [Synechocystis salina LEGE 00041]MBE9255118.1 ParA family protein [Synechocystis salina LEGE 00031]
MKSIAVLSRKGGVGKSTLAMNLAVLAGDATIIDSDPQASCADWDDRRGEGLLPQVVTTPAARVKNVLGKCQSEWVMVDTQPSAEASLIEIATEVDLCVVVLRPGQLELDALGATLAAIRVTQTAAVFCINQAHPSAKLTDLISGLERHHPVGPIIRSRADFPASVAEGLSVTEWNPTGKAATELVDYWSWLKNRYFNV